MLKAMYKITITNWDEHQPKLKKGHKAILISTGFLSNAKMRMVGPTTRLLYLSCLLSAGQLHTNCILVTHDLLCSDSGSTSRLLTSYLDQLESLQLLTWAKVDLLNNRSKENVKKVVVPTNAHQEFCSPKTANVIKLNFESIYAMYPKKVGKTRGIKTCRSEIKTQAEFDQLSQAVSKYAELCVRDKTDPKFIKQFSTFMNCWRDYLDPEIGTSTIKHETGPEAWYRKELEKQQKEQGSGYQEF